MSSPASPGYQPPGQGTAGGTDVVPVLQGVVRQLSNANANMLTLIAAIESIFPRVNGTFTLSAAATLTVTQTGVTADSIILLSPTNASAATLMGSAKALYISARTAGASFQVSTASGGNAAGTEVFSYVVVNPS